MPPKKDKDKKKKKTELSKTGEPAHKVCSRFLKTYEQSCHQTGCLVSPGCRAALKQAIEDEKFLTKLIVEALPVNSPNDPVVLLEPMLSAMRKERYNYIKSLYIWEIPLTNQEITALALLLEKSIYDIKVLEMMDNMIEAYGMRRLSKALPASPAIVNLCLDYNEFGDEGCKYLCEGLYGNATLLSLSLNYCSITAQSAGCLSRILSHTAVRDVYLDGNELGCVGAEKLIADLVEKAETEQRDRRIIAEEKLAAEEEAKRLEEEAKAARFTRGGGASPMPPSGEVDGKDKDKKKKKKGKKKGKKESTPPPEPGPWIHKLHLADNGIDSLENGYEDFMALQCMKTFRRLIASSECLLEIDLEDNLIGDVAGAELLEGLIERKEVNSLSGIKLRTTHRMQGETLKDLIKLGSGAIKKKKGKKKKK